MDLPTIVKALQNSRTAPQALCVLRHYNNPLHEKELHQLQAFRATQQEQLEAGLHVDEEPAEIRSLGARPVKALHPLFILIQVILGTAKLPHVNIRVQKALQQDILPLVCAHTPLNHAECATVLQACAAQSASLASGPKSHRLAVQALLRVCGDVLFAAHPAPPHGWTALQRWLCGSAKTRARAPRVTHTRYVDAAAAVAAARPASEGTKTTNQDRVTSLPWTRRARRMGTDASAPVWVGDDHVEVDPSAAHVWDEEEEEEGDESVEERRRRRAQARHRRRAAAPSRLCAPRHPSAGDAAVAARLKPYQATEAMLLFVRVCCDVVRAVAVAHAPRRRHRVPRVAESGRGGGIASLDSVAEEVMARTWAVMYDEDDASNARENLWRSRDGLRLRRWVLPYLGPLLMPESAASVDRVGESDTYGEECRRVRWLLQSVLNELSPLDFLTLSALLSPYDGSCTGNTEDSYCAVGDASLLGMSKDQLHAVVKSRPDMVHYLLGGGESGWSALTGGEGGSGSAAAAGSEGGSGSGGNNSSALSGAGRLGGAYVRTPLPNTLHLRGPDVSATLRACLYSMTLTSTTACGFQAYCDILLAAAPASAVRRYFVTTGSHAVVQLLLPFVNHAKVLTLSVARVVGRQYGRLFVRMLRSCGHDNAEHQGEEAMNRMTEMTENNNKKKTKEEEEKEEVWALLRGCTEAATLVLSTRCQAATEKASVLRLMGDMYAALQRFLAVHTADNGTDTAAAREAVGGFLQCFTLTHDDTNNAIEMAHAKTENKSSNGDAYALPPADARTSVKALLAVLQREVCTPVAQSAGQALRLVSTLHAAPAVYEGIERAIALARKDAAMRRALLVHLDPRALQPAAAAALAMELFDKCAEVEVSRPDAFLALGVALEHRLWQSAASGGARVAPTSKRPSHNAQPAPSSSPGAASLSSSTAAPLSMGKLAALLSGAEVLGRLHHTDPDEWMRAARVAMTLVESVGQCGPMAMLMTHPRGALRAMLLRYMAHPRTRNDAAVMVGLWDSWTRVVMGLNQPHPPRTLCAATYNNNNSSSSSNNNRYSSHTYTIRRESSSSSSHPSDTVMSETSPCTLQDMSRIMCEQDYAPEDGMHERGGSTLLLLPHRSGMGDSAGAAEDASHTAASAWEAMKVIARTLLSRHIQRIAPSATLAEILLCCGHDVTQGGAASVRHFYDALAAAPQRSAGRRRSKRWNRRCRAGLVLVEEEADETSEKETTRAQAGERRQGVARCHPGVVHVLYPSHAASAAGTAAPSPSGGGAAGWQAYGRQRGVAGGGWCVETDLMEAIFRPRDGRGAGATVVETGFLLTMHTPALTRALVEAMESGPAHVGRAASRAMALLLLLLQRHTTAKPSLAQPSSSALTAPPPPTWLMQRTGAQQNAAADEKDHHDDDESELKNSESLVRRIGPSGKQPARNESHRHATSRDGTHTHTPLPSSSTAASYPTGAAVLVALREAMTRAAEALGALDARDAAIAAVGTPAAAWAMRRYEDGVLREQQLIKTFPARPPKGVRAEDYADMQRAAAAALRAGRAAVRTAVAARAAVLLPTLARLRLPFLATRIMGVTLCGVGQVSDYAVPLLYPCLQQMINATYPHMDDVEEVDKEDRRVSGSADVAAPTTTTTTTVMTASMNTATPGRPAPRVLADLAGDAVVGLLHATPLWSLAAVMSTTTGRLSSGEGVFACAPHRLVTNSPSSSALWGSGRAEALVRPTRRLGRRDVSQIALVAHVLRQSVTHMLPASLFVVLVSFAQAAFRSTHGHTAAATAALSRCPVTASATGASHTQAHAPTLVRGGATIAVATQHQLLGLLLQNVGQAHLFFAAEAMELLSHVLQHFPALYKSVQQGFVQLMPLLPLARLDVVESCFFSGVGTVREVAATAYAKFAHFGRSRRALLLAEIFARDDCTVVSSTAAAEQDTQKGRNDSEQGKSSRSASASASASATSTAALSNVARLTQAIIHDSRYGWSLQPSDWRDAVYFLASYGHDAERVHRVVATMRRLTGRPDTTTEQQMVWVNEVLSIGGLTSVIAVAGLSPTLHPAVAVRVMDFLCGVLESESTSEAVMRCVLESGRVVLADAPRSTLRVMSAELQSRLAKPPKDASAAQKEQYLATSAVWLTMLSGRLRETALLEAMIEQHSRILNNSQSEMVHRCVCASMVELTRGNRHTSSQVEQSSSNHDDDDEASAATVPWVKLDEFVEKCAKQIFHSGSYVKKKAHAWGLVGVLHGLGLPALRRYGMVRRIQKAAKEKSAERSGAMVMMEVMCEVMGRTVEPYVLALSEILLDGVADPDAKISDCADDAARVLMTQLTAVGLRQLIPHLVGILSAEQAKKRVAPLNFIGNVAFCSPKQLAATLPQIMKPITACLFDINNAVAVAAYNALRRVAGVVSCPEIQEHVERILGAMRSPSTETESALDALLYTRFTNVVDPASLALILPVLARGLGGQQPRTRPKAAQIVAAMVSLVAEVKTLEPYAAELESLLEEAAQDPQAEARTTAARALGALAAAMRGVLIDRIANWAFAILQRVQAGSIEKMGAAQVFVELVHSCGGDVLQAYFPVVAAGMTDERPPVREGFLCILVYAPTTFRPEMFQNFLPLAFPWVLDGLSHFSDKVREVALTAGDGIIALYGTRHLSLVLTPLLSGVTSEVTTMRHSSLLLSAKLLLHLVSLIRKRMRMQAAAAAAAASASASASTTMNNTTTDDGAADDGADTTSAAAAASVLLLESARSAEKRGISVLGSLEDTLGADALVQLLAAIYCGRHEHHAGVRTDCNMAWQACVASIRAAVHKMFDALVTLLIHLCASDNADCVDVAGKTMEYTTSMNEMVERLMEALCARYQEGSSRVKLGALVGLQHMVPLTDAKRLIGMGGQIVGCVLPGMQESEPLVRQAAREVFARVTRSVGARLIESAVEAQLTTSVRGVVEVVKVKPSVALAIVFKHWSGLRAVQRILQPMNNNSGNSSGGAVKARDVTLLAAILDVSAAAEELRRYTELMSALLLACLCARRRGVRRVVRRFVEFCPRDRESAPLDYFLRALHSPRTRRAGLQALEAYGLSTDVNNVDGITAVLRAVMGVLGDDEDDHDVRARDGHESEPRGDEQDGTDGRAATPKRVHSTTHVATMNNSNSNSNSNSNHCRDVAYLGAAAAAAATGGSALKDDSDGRRGDVSAGESTNTEDGGAAAAANVRREEVEEGDEEDTNESDEDEAEVSMLSLRAYAVRIVGALLSSLERRLIATLPEEEQSDVTLSKRAAARYLMQYLDTLTTTLSTVAQASATTQRIVVTSHKASPSSTMHSNSSNNSRTDSHDGSGGVEEVRTWLVLGTGEPRLFDVCMTFYNRALDYGTAEQRVTAVHGIRDLLAWAPREVSAAAANTVAGRCSKVLFARNDGAVVQALVELCLQLLHYPASGKEKMVEGTMALAMFNAALCDSGAARVLTLRAVVELLQRSSRYADLMLGTVLTRRTAAMESTTLRGVMLRFVATVMRYAAGAPETAAAMTTTTTTAPSAAAATASSPLRHGLTSSSAHVTRLLEMTMTMWDSAETPALACASGCALGALCRSISASDALVADVKERTLAATSVRGTTALAGLSLVYSLLTSAAVRADATFLQVVAENIAQLAAEAKMTDKLSVLWTLRAAGAVARTRCVSAAVFRPEAYVSLMKRIGANDEQAQSTAQYFYDAVTACYPAAVPLFEPYYREPSAQWHMMGHFDAEIDDEVVADMVY